MKGKALGVGNKNWRNNYDNTFCNGCKEIGEYFKEHKHSRSCKCSDCGRTLLNLKHRLSKGGSNEDDS